MHLKSNRFTLKGQYNLSDNRQVPGVSPGECRRHGAFAEYVAVPDHILYKIPDNVSFAEAAMLEPAAVAAHAVKISHLTFNNTVVVGAGMIGYFMISLLKLAGAEKVPAIDIDSSKEDIAKKFGANLFVNSTSENLDKTVLAATYGRGADLAIDEVGTSPSVNTAISCVRKGGSVTLVGNLSQKVEVPLQQIITRQLRLQGSYSKCGEYTVVLSLMQNGKINLTSLVSKVVPLKEGTEWIDRLYKKEKGLNKVFLVP